jgi:hypothetical protein
MHPVIRALGKVLRLVGISSPEDSLAKPAEENGPPSWRKAAAVRAAGVEAESPTEPGGADGQDRG